MDYPETELERHGLTPDTWGSAGCYALGLDTPTLTTFRERWHRVYDISPPRSLIEAVDYDYPTFYVGATGNLRERLADHVNADVRKVKLLAVCPPTRVVAVWTHEDFDTAEEKERSHAYTLKEKHPTALCWVNGAVV